MFRTDVDEMNVEPVNLGDEMREGLESRLALAPIVLRRPVARERLSRRELDALRLIRDSLLLRPAGGGDALTQILELRLGVVSMVNGRIGVAGAVGGFGGMAGLGDFLFLLV